MSESPGSETTITATLYILPQAVPILNTGCKQTIISCFPMRLTEFDVVSVEVVNLRLGEHGVVLKLSSSDGGAVVSNKDEL